MDYLRPAVIELAGARAEGVGARGTTVAVEPGAEAGANVVQFPLAFSAFGRGWFVCWKLSPHRCRHASPPVPASMHAKSTNKYMNEYFFHTVLPLIGVQKLFFFVFFL